MELVKILNLLGEFNPRIISKVDIPVYIQTHKRMMHHQAPFYPNCIYVGYTSDLPEFIDENSLTSLICIEDLPLSETNIKNDLLNLAVVENTVEPHEILNKIADIMIDEAQIVSSMQILLDALYANKGLQYLVDVAVEVFENPVFINDTAYKILAMSNKMSFEDNTLEEEKLLGYIHEKNLLDMRNDSIFKQLSQSTYPLYSKRKNSAVGWLFKIISIQGVEVGLVALVETNRTFRKYDFELLERFSKLVSIELEKNDFYKINKGLMYSYFLADLISDKLHRSKLIEQRLSYLHWKLYSCFQVMFITDFSRNVQERKVNLIAHEIRNIIPDCHWTVYQNNLIVLINRPSKTLLTSKEQTRLIEFLGLNQLSSGMSNVYFNIMETSRHYRQSLRAAELGIYINHKPGIYYYSDYAMAYIAKSLSKRHDIHEFCPPAIGILQEYDSRFHSNLLDTLENYLNYPENPVAASEALHIHRNTLLYRINKIKELTEMDLSNGDIRLNLQLYFKFMMYLKGSWDSDERLEES